jgi:hypothetical protein
MKHVPIAVVWCVCLLVTLEVRAQTPADSIVHPGEVVINEFMAECDSVFGPIGKLDDWIELYNTSARDISLAGCLMTNALPLHDRWQFSSKAIIHSGEFIVVWADMDTCHPGIHALFELSGNGDAIVLYNKNLSIVDSITFGVQTRNMTMARIPDGTGPFVLSRPSMGIPNVRTSVGTPPFLPWEVSLAQNYPNPFNPTTAIRYQLPAASKTKICVCNLLGQVVATLVEGYQEAGTHTVQFDAGNLSSGVYFYRLDTGGFSATRRMVLVR